MKKNSNKLQGIEELTKLASQKPIGIILRNESFPFAIRSVKVDYYQYFHYPGSVSQLGKA